MQEFAGGGIKLVYCATGAAGDEEFKTVCPPHKGIVGTKKGAI
jgi:hypothetical protein